MYLYLYINNFCAGFKYSWKKNEFAVARNSQVQIQVLFHPTQKQLPDRTTATVQKCGRMIVFSCLYKNRLYFLKLEELNVLWEK